MINFKKKGGMEMSLNLIIMLIIGLVVLGLIITFVNKMMNQADDKFQVQLDEQDRQMLEQALDSPDNLAIIPGPSITIKKGQDVKLFLKVRNTGTQDFDVGAGNLFGELGTLTVSIVNDEGSEVSGDNTFTLAGPGFTTETGNSEANAYIFKAGIDIENNKYYFMTLTLTDEQGNTYTKKITVKVK